MYAVYIYAHISIHGQTERVGINRSVVRHRVVAGRQAMFVYTEKYVFAYIYVHICMYAAHGRCRYRGRLGNELILIERRLTVSCCRQLLSDPPTSRGIVDTEQFFGIQSAECEGRSDETCAGRARPADAMFRRPTVRHVGTLLLQSNLV